MVQETHMDNAIGTHAHRCKHSIHVICTCVSSHVAQQARHRLCDPAQVSVLSTFLSLPWPVIHVFFICLSLKPRDTGLGNSKDLSLWSQA